MPRLVALLPHMESTEDSGQEIFGMNIVTIPFSNEMRPVETMDLGGVGGEPVTAEEEDAAEELVRRMQFAEGFQYQDLQSPAIQHMYAVLQAVALNQVRNITGDYDYMPQGVIVLLPIQESSEWRAESDMLQPDPDG